MMQVPCKNDAAENTTNKLIIILTLESEKSYSSKGIILEPEFSSKCVLYKGPITSFSRRATCCSQFFCQNLDPLLAINHNKEKTKPKKDNPINETD